MRSNILMIVIMGGIIGCSDANGGGDKTTPGNIKHRVITPNSTEIRNAGHFDESRSIIPVEIHLDDLAFKEAFRIEYLAKGEGHVFWWRGSQYITDLHENKQVADHGWVQNANDIDDKCSSNNYDECGICEGPGKLFWYRDLDNDGLGNPKIFIKSCTYPSVDEE